MAAVALIFFTVAGIGLCRGFVLETVLCWAGLDTAEQCWHSVQAFLIQQADEGAQEFGRGHSQDRQSQVAQGISQTTEHHAQHVKQGEKEGRG